MGLQNTGERKMIPMHCSEKTGGFTLVELLVVIAILAALSSVAVTGYTGYITSMNNVTVESFLNELKTNIVLANAGCGNIDMIEVFYVGEGYLLVVVSAVEFADDFVSDLKYACPSAMDIAPNDIYHITAYSFYIPAPSGWAKSDYGEDGKITFNCRTNTWE